MWADFMLSFAPSLSQISDKHLCMAVHFSLFIAVRYAYWY
jgi:hypothetical protein